MFFVYVNKNKFNFRKKKHVHLFMRHNPLFQTKFDVSLAHPYWICMLHNYQLWPKAISGEIDKLFSLAIHPMPFFLCKIELNYYCLTKFLRFFQPIRKPFTKKGEFNSTSGNKMEYGNKTDPIKHKRKYFNYFVQ